MKMMRKSGLLVAGFLVVYGVATAISPTFRAQYAWFLTDSPRGPTNLEESFCNGIHICVSDITLTEGGKVMEDSECPSGCVQGVNVLDGWDKPETCTLPTEEFGYVYNCIDPNKAKMVE